MNCIAVDDEPLSLILLNDNISKVPFLNLVASCENALDALQVLEKQKIDLVFIDIQMPGLSGLKFIASLEHRPFVIFVTAYKEFAIESYELAVVDYLVKPVALERFIKACLRAKELFELKSSQQLEEGKSSQDYFFVQADYSQVRVVFDDIIFIEGLGDYLKIHLDNSDKPLVIRSSLKNIMYELPTKKFLRIHKSYIISLSKIKSVRKNSISVDRKELPIGESFREALEKFIQGML